MEKFPENTLSGIRAALDAGACMVEFDVQMDANKQLVVLHDDSFKRTAGISQSVFKQQGYTQISVHEPDRLADAFNPEPVPMLTQVADLLARYPAATAFVEIKDESLDQWGMQNVVDRVLACIEPVKHQCVIIADSLDALLYTNRQSDHEIGWVIHRYDKTHRELADKYAPDYLICNYKRISGDPWPGSWQWMLYDISDPELAMTWAQKGIELIETRDIGGMLQHPLLQQRACNHVVVQN
jgi:glycerophosphoryl diester phosphodiesterase